MTTVRMEAARQTRFGDRDIAGLIRIYEASYVRLTKLVPDLSACNRVMISRVAGALDLHLEIIERQPYTTSLVLTYRFPDYDGFLLEPNARINVYHDVRAAEVLHHSRRRKNHTIRPWTPGRMPELDRKWQMNRFLLKWLRFCTFQGHIFLPGITPTLDQFRSAPTLNTLPYLHRTPRADAQAASTGVVKATIRHGQGGLIHRRQPSSGR